jgi:hypothetical protein
MDGIWNRYNLKSTGRIYSMLPHNQNCQKIIFKIINLQMY